MALIQILIVAGCVLAGIGGRVSLLAVRGGFHEEMLLTRSYVANVLSALTFIAQISLLVLGFFYFQWWQWLLIFVSCLIVGGLLVGRSRFAFFYSTHAVFDFLSVVAASAAWGAHLDLISL